jgi:hypothetical protein
MKDEKSGTAQDAGLPRNHDPRRGICPQQPCMTETPFGRVCSYHVRSNRIAAGLGTKE